MKIAETVTFGGSGLDRAAQLRIKTDVLAGYIENDAPVLMMWRGKPLVRGEKRDALAWVTKSHPLVADRADRHVFLGLDGDQAWFAVDVSHWEPQELDRESLGLFLDPSEQHPPDVPTDHVFAELRMVMTRLSARDAELAATAKAVLGWHRTHRFCAACGAESQMTQAGWQRTCGTCGAHHFPRTDPVVIMLITYGNKVLLGRSPGWPDRMYSLLAGFVEPGETIEAAVRREVYEETHIKVGRVGYLTSQPWPFPASLMFGCYGEALNQNIKVDPTEIEDAIWVTREQMMDIFAGQHDRVLPPRKGAIAGFLLENWIADRLD
ncbi:NAD(+) diphosphatase [Pseudaestuariivita rosea]|uniref:NAD(+) diphosphatase n=1 Tax=Pseudaestuariivita rosea TaxID=2763263 RepID=UPI001ABA2EDC|nr:NAD(+) diphosphatase [Pseudaestuariivita rosea]